MRRTDMNRMKFMQNSYYTPPCPQQAILFFKIPSLVLDMKSVKFAVIVKILTDAFSVYNISWPIISQQL
jgi:hypothetical protein